MKIPIDIKTGEVKKEQETKEIIVGIDLGTTNSLVAYMDEGTPKVILDETGAYALLPSIIHFTKSGKILVGHEAKNELKYHPERTIRSVKRLMGKSYADIKDFTRNTAYEIIDGGAEQLVKIKMDDKFYSPVELSAEILKSLKKRAENQLNAIINKAVITVPAYFNDTQRQATRDAGKLAGLDVLRIINEPTAASLAYGLGLKADEKETVAVYDFGGGTFDVSILQLENGIFEVLSTHGDTNLGGDDIDHLIVDFWLKKYPQLEKKLTEIGGLTRLVSLAEESKIVLTDQNNFDYRFDEKFSVHLDRPSLNEIMTPLIDSTLSACRNAIRDAKINKDDINKVILVGGTTRIPIIKEMLQKFFGIPPYDSLHPDETVALGAAIQADILAGNRKDILLLDVTPLSLGIETVGGLMDVIIPRNSKIPHQAGRQYTTSVDGQKNLKISIYQGERDLVENNRKLGEFILKNIPPMPAGFPKLDIQFLIDADGILTVRAKELRSDTTAEIEIMATYGISEEKMAEMLLESIKNAETDALIKSLIETKVEAKNILLATEKFLVQNAGIMNHAEKDRMRVLSEELKQSVEKDNKNDIEVIMKNLNDFASPIAQKALDNLISRSLLGKSIEE